MPELPEVEVTKQSLKSHLQGRQIEHINVREKRLRWPLNLNQLNRLLNQDILSLSRRGKYILINSERGTALIHLGMSGTIHLVSKKNYRNTNVSFYGSSSLPVKHNHIVIFLEK